MLGESNWIFGIRSIGRASAPRLYPGTGTLGEFTTVFSQLWMSDGSSFSLGIENVNAGLGVSWIGGGPVRETDSMKSGVSCTCGTGGAHIGANESDDSENSATFTLCSGFCSGICRTIASKARVGCVLITGASNSLDTA